MFLKLFYKNVLLQKRFVTKTFCYKNEAVSLETKLLAAFPPALLWGGGYKSASCLISRDITKNEYLTWHM